MTTRLKLQPSMVYQVCMRNIPLLWSIVTCLGSWTILLVMCSTFSESFNSIPKYVYFSYTKTLKHCFLVTNDAETKLSFRPWLLNEKTLALLRHKQLWKLCTHFQNTNSFHMELHIHVVRAVIKRWRPGIFTGYFQLFSLESRRKIEPKGTPSCLILPPPPYLLDLPSNL